MNTAFISYMYICSTLSVSNSPNYTEVTLGQMPGACRYFKCVCECGESELGWGGGGGEDSDP